MQFVHRIRTIWSWLPAFRAVAETQHLPSAARELGVVPSSLSRMVKLLEDELGIELFERAAKTLVLNDAGRQLLLAVREAMRVVDEAVTAALSHEPSGSAIVVASADLARAILVPASALLAQRHAALVVAIRVAREREIPDLLLRGEADVALVVQAPPVHTDLRASEVVRWPRAAYARRGAERGQSPSCVAVGLPNEQTDDGWPVARSRRVAAWVHDEVAALELVAATDLVAVALEALAQSPHFADRVQVLDDVPIEPLTVFLVHRRAVGVHMRTNTVVEAIRAVLTR